jgi:chromosome segregation ATPase
MPTKTGQALNHIAKERTSAQELCQSCWDSWDALVDSLTNDKDALDDEVSDLLDKIQDYKQEIALLRERLAVADHRYNELVETVSNRTDQAAHLERDDNA